MVILKTGFKVSDAMTEQPVTISSNLTLKEAASLMAKKHVGSLIIKEKGKVQGIMTEKDMVRKGIAKGKDPVKTKVKEVMNPKFNTIDPDADIFDALKVMRDLNIRHLPVVRGKEMIGLLTLKDILKIEPDLFDLLVDKFELREEERKPIYNIGEKEGICNTCGEYAQKLYSKDGVMICKKCK